MNDAVKAGDKYLDSRVRIITILNIFPSITLTVKALLSPPLPFLVCEALEGVIRVGTFKRGFREEIIHSQV